MQRKKLNKQKRDLLREQKANEYNEAFLHGFKVGVEVGKKEKEKELKEWKN